MNVGLGAERLCQLVDFEGQCDQIFLLAVKHVVTNAFREGLEEVRLLDHVEMLVGLFTVQSATTGVLGHIAVLLICLLDVFVELLKGVFLLHDEPVDLVVLLSQVAEGVGDFIFLLVASFP